MVRLGFTYLGSTWEDDWARYLWEGGTLLKGISPYSHSPQDFFSSPGLSAFETELLSRINHPEWTAIYSPVVLGFFALSVILDPRGTLGLSVLYLIIDLVLFRHISKTYGKESSYLYWIHPVWVWETYGNLHFEILGILLLLLCFSKPYLVRGLVGGLVLSIKPFFGYLVFFPKIKKVPLFFLSLLLGYALPYFAFVLYFGTKGWQNLFLWKDFAQSFVFNPVGRYAMEFIFPQKGVMLLSSVIVILSLLSSIFLFAQRQLDMRERIKTAGILMTLGLCFSPIVNSWYFLPLIPLGAIAKDTTLLFLSFVILLSYATKQRLGIETEGYYNIPDWIMGMEAILLLLLVFFVLAKKTRIKVNQT